MIRSISRSSVVIVTIGLEQRATKTPSASDIANEKVARFEGTITNEKGSLGIDSKDKYP
jgi:hypothetical protein